MAVLKFHICRQGRDRRWAVLLGDAPYGDYLDRGQALIDAVEAARDARHLGREAQVWLSETADPSRGPARIF